jgi:hypothetical protein
MSSVGTFTTNVNLHYGKSFTSSSFTRINIIMLKKVLVSVTALIMVSSTNVIAQSDTPRCGVSVFQSIVMSETRANKRKVKATEWLTANLERCSLEELVVLQNNRASWLGTADSLYFKFLIKEAIDGKK